MRHGQLNLMGSLLKLGFKFVNVTISQQLVLVNRFTILNNKIVLGMSDLLLVSCLKGKCIIVHIHWHLGNLKKTHLVDLRLPKFEHAD